jgi:hypothetical protein
MTMKIAVACLAAITGAASAQNLVQNPGFETQGSGFNIFANWGTFTNAFADPPFGSGLPPEVAFIDGSSMVHLKTFGGFFGADIQSDTGAFQEISVTAGNEYTISVSTLTPAADAIQEQIDDGDPATFDEGHLPLYIIDFKDAAGVVLSSGQIDAHDFSANPLDVWTEYSGTFTAPPGAVSAQVTCILIQFGLPAGALYWDNASVTEEMSGPMPCNAADLAEPFGQLTFGDISAFLNLFNAGCP